MKMGNELPEECIAEILSATSPGDACRSSCVSTIFRSAASSDCVWGSFLPSDYLTILSGSGPGADSSPLNLSSKKDLFFYLSHKPVLIDQGKKSFSLDKWSGKKCYMIAPRDLVIIWGAGDTPNCWDWISHPASRFEEVAQLKIVWWLEIRGKISTSMLSLDTNYAAYLVFKLQENAYGFDEHPAEVSPTLGADNICTKSIILDPLFERRARQRRPRPNLERAKVRADGWLEIEIGNFFNRYGEDEVEISVMEVRARNAESGLVVGGIEFRPKERIGKLEK